MNKESRIGLRLKTPMKNALLRRHREMNEKSLSSLVVRALGDWLAIQDSRSKVKRKR